MEWDSMSHSGSYFGQSISQGHVKIYRSTRKHFIPIVRCKVLCSHRDIGTARAAAPVDSKTILSGLGLKPPGTNPQNMSHQAGSRPHVQVVVVPCMSRHRPKQRRAELVVSGFSETSSRDPQQQMAWAEDCTV